MHLESVKEFQGGSVANQKVIEYGQAVSTALGVVPCGQAARPRLHGPRSRRHDGKNGRDLHGRARTCPRRQALFTNKFVGSAKLTEAEWAEVEKRSEKYLPRKSS